MEAFKLSFLDDWKEWSTAKKAISIIAVCCVGILIIGIIGGGLSSDKNTSPTTGSDTSDSSTNDAKEDTVEQAKGVQVHIITDGSWSGSVGDIDGQSTYDGSGEDTIDLGDADSIVSVVIQKKSGGSSELKVEILKDGKVIKDGSTTAEYGVVTVSTSI